MTRRGPVVVKLGGSLAAAPELESWLDALGRAGGGCAVVVPGGGPFAEQVRYLQPRLGFDDATAHHLAILAMEQFARVLAARRPALVLADSRRAIGRGLRAGEVPVWLAARMTFGRREIAESWQVTSDSLAAWLAGALGAKRLILIKSAEPPSGPVAVLDLAKGGMVDPAFPEFLSTCGARAWCLGPGGAGALAEALRSDRMPAAEILPG